MPFLSLSLGVRAYISYIADVTVSSHSGHPTRVCIPRLSPRRTRAGIAPGAGARVGVGVGEGVRVVHLWSDKWTALSGPLS